MKRPVVLLLWALMVGGVSGQTPLKVRPDALPPVAEVDGAKIINMAATREEMRGWDRYPTYETYVGMMQRWADSYAGICTLDTIGTSVEGRLILAVHIEGGGAGGAEHPEFFYSSTIHGDEVTGYVMMLHLIDTLLGSYGSSARLTELVDRTAIYINPLSNPDGAYYRGNHTVQGSRRYNADGMDLNRTYPDPFGGTAKVVPQENEAMMEYVGRHHFVLSANLHGGSEVMNYPWDCFTSVQSPHPSSGWWQEVCRRFVDTCRVRDDARFRDVNSSGVIAGGDWYVIHGGRQDYMNYYHNCLEVTMEISSVKTLSSSLLPDYWHVLAPSLINYIEEIHHEPGILGMGTVAEGPGVLTVYPNPVGGAVTVSGVGEGAVVELYDLNGRRLGSWQCGGEGWRLPVDTLPQGVYLVHADGQTVKIVKK